MHLLVYSKDAKQGWLTKKGIDELRSALGNDIFRLEQYKLFAMETNLRDRLKRESREEIEKLFAKIRESYAPTTEIEMLFLKLVSQLKTCKGPKQYGYLPKDVKDTVNKIVLELAKDESIARLNTEWNKVNREKLSLYHEKKKPDIPLEDNPEFRSIKNVIVRSAALAMRIMGAEPTPNYDVGSAMKSVVSALSRPKTENSVRLVSIPQEAVDLLTAEHSKHPANPYMFPSPKTGEMYHPDSIVNLHKKILKSAGLGHLKFHELRHTFATTALQNGVDVKTVSSMLGHYDAGFTLRTYTHATRQKQEQAAEKMGSFMQQVR